MIIRETFVATVTGNQDPEQRGRIRVTCVGIMGDEESELPMWVEPSIAWGWFVVPDIGELVDIDLAASSSEDEQIGQFSIDNSSPVWRGARHYGGSEGDAPRPVPADFLTNYGKRRGMATPGGHVILFDDTNGKRRVSITRSDKDGNLSTLAFEEDDSFSIVTNAGHSIRFDATDGFISLKDSNDNEYKSDSSGVTIRCTNAVIEADKVEVGSAGLSEALILGTKFITDYFNKHTHPTGTGPSGIPINQGATATLSTKCFVE